MGDAPLVSIIVPSFNQGRYIGATLESILAQDYRPIEVLVFDGASTDDTLDVLEAFRSHPEVVVRSERDDGVTDAVNKGLKAARGSILAIQSSDDLYLPGAFSEVVRFFEKNPDIGLVYGDVEYVDESSRRTGRTTLAPFDLDEHLAKRSFIPQAATFFRADATHRTAGWRAEVSYAADADHFLRMALGSGAAKIDRLLGSYRYHPAQRDKAGPCIAAAWERAVREILDSQPLGASARRSARVGVCLTAHHYTPERSWVTRTRLLYQALANDPRLLFRSGFPKRELIPGRTPIWAFLSRVKRRLGIAPRTA
jgi:glycosyltransferase involved in cell wall biosynthesis